MSERDEQTPEPEAETGPGVRLAESWADVTKALALYPDSNERVRSKLDEVLDALGAVLAQAHAELGADPERGIAILFQDDRVHVGVAEHTFEPQSPLAWLRARLDRSALAGVELMPDLTAEELTAFTRKLLDNYLRKDGERTFEALWPEMCPGVVLIDRRFEGTFGGPAGMGAYAGGHGGVVGDETRHFITGLLMHPKVRARLERIQAHGADEDEHGDEGETGLASELLREVLEDVPADALKSRDTLINWVCTRLEDLGGRLGEGDGPREKTEGERFAQLLQSVSQKHFAREGPNLDRIKAGTYVEMKPGGGRKRDAEITDDLESLVAEVQALPGEVTMRLGAEDAAAAPEQLAVVLHYAVHLERPEELPGLARLLGQLLEEPGPDELAVLREYVRLDADADDEASARSTTAVIHALEAAGRNHLLRACGALSVPFVVETFPRHWAHFVSALDIDLDHELAELDTALERIGPDRVLKAAREIMPAIEGLSREKIQRLLEQPKRCRLPLARLILQGRDKTAVIAAANYLKALELPEAEAFLLQTIRPVALLTPEYLIGLIDLHLGRVSAFALRAPVSDVLCRHIAAVGDADPLDRSRLDSIRLLARYPATGGERMLRTLRRRIGFGPWVRGEPKHVRKLARSLLKNWQAA